MSESATLVLQWWWMLLLLPLPWIYRAFRKALADSSPALAVPVYQQLLGDTDSSASSHSSRPVSYLLLTLVWLGCLLAAARPVWIGEEVELPTSGRDLLLAVDLSISMEAPDMPVGRDIVRRIDAVKAVVGEFVKRRSGDRVGLILFGEQAYLQTPLTFDSQTLYKQLYEAQLGMAGNGTAIGNAIGIGVKHLKERPENHRVMILLTDGANTAGEVLPREAAEAAAQLGARIYTVGVGGGRGTLRTLLRGSELDEATLQAIAEKTAGRYFRARDVQQLNDIYLELDKLEPIEQEAETLRPSKSLFHWPLAAALLATFGLLIRQAIRGGHNV